MARTGRADAGPTPGLRLDLQAGHLKHVFAKLGVSSRTELAVMVVAVTALALGVRSQPRSFGKNRERAVHGSRTSVCELPGWPRAADPAGAIAGPAIT